MHISLYITPQNHTNFQKKTQTPIKPTKSPHKSNQILSLHWKKKRERERMDEKFHFDTMNKAISRTSSVGYSSHSIYYCGTAEGVPFKWEIQPGTPKDPPTQEFLPPLSPPPAVLSLGLPKPCIIEQPKTRHQPRMRLRFWRRSKKSRDSERAAQGTPIDYSNEEPFDHNDKLETLSFLSSDCEFMASPRDSMSLSSSSSPSSLLESLSVRNMRRVSFGRPPSCGAWQINRILACYHA